MSRALAVVACLIGLWLIVTTPTYPGSPTDPTLHPALHIVIGAFALCAGGLWLVLDLLDER